MGEPEWYRCEWNDVCSHRPEARRMMEHKTDTKVLGWKNITAIIVNGEKHDMEGK